TSDRQLSLNADTIIIESGTSIFVDGTLSASELLKIVTNNGNITITGAIQAKDVDGLNELMLIAYGNRIQDGDLKGFYEFKANGKSYYKDNPRTGEGNVFERVGDTLIQVVNPESLELRPVIHPTYQDVKDEQTGLSLYEDDHGKIFYRDVSINKYYRWLQTNDLYSFQGVNYQTGDIELFYSTHAIVDTSDPEYDPNTIIYFANGTDEVDNPTLLDLIPYYIEVEDQSLIDALIPITIELSSGNINIVEGILTVPDEKLSLYAQRGLIGVDLGITINDANGEVEISIGTDLVIDSVIQANQKISLASMGYISIDGEEKGGNLTLNHQPIGNSGSPHQIDLSALESLYLNTDISAIDNISIIVGKQIVSTDQELITTARLDIITNQGLTLETDVDEINISVVENGQIVISEVDSIILNNVTTANGSISIVANGTISARYVKSLNDTTGNDVSLTATQGDILIDFVAAGRATSKIYIDSVNGSISEDPGLTDADDDIVASFASLKAFNVIGSQENPELSLETDVSVLEIDAYDLIMDVDGDVELDFDIQGVAEVTATGTITVNNLTAADGSITLNAGGDILIDTLSAGIDGHITLVSGGSINVTTLITASTLTVTSAGNINLITDIDSLDATITGTGDLTVVETDDIILTNLDMANGSVSVTAAGSILDGTISAAGNTVTLTSSGSITASQITAATLNAQASGDITLTTTVDNLDIVTGVTGTVNWISTGVALVSAGVSASQLVATADGDLTLNTSVETVEIDAGSTGNITLTSVGVSQVTAEISALTLDMTADSDVTLTTTASETTIDAGSSNDVSIGLTRDGPATVNATAAGLNATALNNLTLNTTADSLSAQVIDTGIIAINETDGLSINTVSTVDGSIEITTGSNLTATQIQSLTDSDTNDITIISGGLITADLIDAGTQGDVSLTAAGNIQATIIADELN
ncbi:MAG: hypothetical protein MI922_20240, partial [Bacteroidales bacterium]|nr:hypothetical protein [Bacteroidales bacterium]